MAQTEDQKPKGNATDFIKLQSDLDKAKDELLKDEPEANGNKEDVTIKTDVSQKKTGSGKQVSPGT